MRSEHYPPFLKSEGITFRIIFVEVIDERQRLKELERKNRELRHSNDILRQFCNGREHQCPLQSGGNTP